MHVWDDFPTKEKKVRARQPKIVNVNRRIFYFNRHASVFHSLLWKHRLQAGVKATFKKTSCHVANGDF